MSVGPAGSGAAAVRVRGQGTVGGQTLAGAVSSFPLYAVAYNCRIARPPIDGAA